MSNNQNEQMQQFAEMFKALSNPHRLHIFLRLISCCPPGTRCTWDSEAKRYVGQLAEEVNIAASTVSHHIKELRNAGLIRVARRGKNIECWVDTAPVEALSDLLAGRLPSGLLQDEPSREKDDWTRNAASRERTGTPSCGQNCDSVDPAASASSLPVISRLIRPAVDNRESPEREGQVQ